MINQNPIFDRIPNWDVDLLPGGTKLRRELLKLTFHEQRRDYYKAKIEEYKDWIIENYTEEAYELLQLAAERAWISQDGQLRIHITNEKDNRIELKNSVGKELREIVITAILGHIVQISSFVIGEFRQTTTIKGGLTTLIEYFKTLAPLTYTEDHEAITRSGEVCYL